MYLFWHIVLDVTTLKLSFKEKQNYYAGTYAVKTKDEFVLKTTWNQGIHAL